MPESIFNDFKVNMARLYLKYYEEHGKEKCLDFCLKNSVSMYVLLGLYDLFIIDAMQPIEDIDKNKKQAYWDLAGTYFTETEKRIQASKVIYTMELIAGNF